MSTLWHHSVMTKKKKKQKRNPSGFVCAIPWDEFRNIRFAVKMLLRAAALLFAALMTHSFLFGTGPLVLNFPAARMKQSSSVFLCDHAPPKEHFLVTMTLLISLYMHAVIYLSLALLLLLWTLAKLATPVTLDVPVSVQLMTIASVGVCVRVIVPGVIFFFFLQIFSSQAVNVALKWTSLYPNFCPSNLVVADTKAAAFNLLSGTQKLVTGCIYFLQNKCIATGENYVAHWATVPLHKILKVCKYLNTFRIAFPTLVLV